MNDPRERTNRRGGFLPLRDWSFSRKIEMAILVATAICVAFVGVFFLLFELRKERRALMEQIEVLTGVIAANSTAHVAFRDKEAATALLQSLHAAPVVVQAAILDAQGEPLATIGEPPPAEHAFASPEPDGVHIEGGLICVRQPVTLDGERIGSVVVRAHRLQEKARITRYAGVVIVVILVGFAAAALIARKLRGVLSGSLLRLADTAKQIRDTGDFSLRASSGGSDEVGLLVESFNEMLGLVQRSDRQIRSNLQFLETLLDTIPMPVFVQDRAGAFQRFNRVFARDILGAPGEAIVGRKPGDLESPWPAEAVETLATQAASAIQHGTITTYDIALPSAHAGRREFIASTASFRDAEDRAVGVLTILMDVTERNKTVEDLRRSEERFRAIYEGTATGILLFDLEGLCIDTNRRANELFGSIDEVGELACPIDILERNPLLRAEIDTLLAGSPTSEHHELPLVTGDGRSFWGDISLGLIARADGRPEAVTCLVVDVSDRRRLEADLLDAAAHEQRKIAQDIHDNLGQILASIAYKSKVLKRFEDRASKEERDELQSLADLSNEALRQARDLAHGIDPVDLTEQGLPEALHKLADSTTEHYEVDCSYEGPSRIQLAERSAGTHLYRIAQEATKNALWHGRAHTIRIRVRSNEREVVMTVTDDGIGFDPSDDHRKGMGLRAMAYRTRIMRGTFTIERGETRGMRLVVTVPAARTNEE